MPGFGTVAGGSHTVLIRPEWKACLLDDLLGDFDGVEASRRRLYAHGRVTHFSYLPSNASARVFVRRATRGGLIGALLGGLYTRVRRPLQEIRAATVARSAAV